MTFPVKPDEHYDYVAWQEGEPGLPLPAPQVAADFDHQKSSIDQTIDFIKGSFTSEGRLRIEKLPAPPFVPVITDSVPSLPGYIMAMADNGDWRPYQSPTAVSSRSFCEIKKCYAIGTEIGLEFKEKHTFVTGDDVFARVYGRDMRSYRAHPANNWSGGALRHPTTGALSTATGSYAWGGDAWEGIEVIDEWRIRLPNSVFKTDPADADPEFKRGYAYLSQETGPAEYLKEAIDWLGGRKGVVTMGVGWYCFLNGEFGIDIPSNVTLRGAGLHMTHLVAGDFFNQQVLSWRGRDCEASDFSLWGNRMFYGQGLHVARVGSEDVTAPIENVALRRIAIIGSSGYGLNSGKNSDKINFVLEDVEVIWSNNDLLDTKNKGRGNRHNRLIRFKGETYGLNNVGTNRGMNKVTLAANPITTVNDGRTTVVVTLKIKPRPNDTVWLSAVTVAGVSLSGWYFVEAATNFNATIETGQQANASTTGGGTGIQTMHFHREKGSVAFDLRGPGWIADVVQIHGDLDQCVGPRTRGGNGTNGPGAHRSILSNIEVTDECPRPTSSAQLMVLQSDDVVVQGAVLTGIGGNNKGASVGLTIGNLSTRAQVSGVVISNVGTDVVVNGSKAKVQWSSYACGNGPYVNGEPVGTTGSLDSTTPFRVETAGADPTVICRAEVAHGFSGGEAADFAEATINPSINLDMNGTFTVVSVLSTLEFTVTATGQTALATGSFGGDSVEYVTAPIETSAADNELTYRAFSTYGRPGIITAKAARTKIINSHAQDSGTPAIDDNSTSTIYGPGNTGEIPNTRRVITIDNAATSYDLKPEDSGSIVYYAGANTVTLNLPNPALKTVYGFSIEVIYRSSGGTGFAVKTPAGLIRSGTGTTTGGGAYTSSTEGARARISWGATDRWFLEPGIGTWTAS